MTPIRWLARHDTLTLRLTLLVGLMVVIAGLDYVRNRQRATRWREYSFLLGMGLVGSMTAMGIDLVTSSISPEYFLLGKGLEGRPSFRLEVLKVGAQAGFVMGTFMSGALLVANAPRRTAPSLRLRRMARSCRSVLFLALVGACALGLLADAWPLEIPFETSIRVPPERQRSFATVWWAHLGAYAGALVGLAVQVRSVSIERRLAARRAS